MLNTAYIFFENNVFSFFFQQFNPKASTRAFFIWVLGNQNLYCRQLESRKISTEEPMRIQSKLKQTASSTELCWWVGFLDQSIERSKENHFNTGLPSKFDWKSLTEGTETRIMLDTQNSLHSNCPKCMTQVNSLMNSSSTTQLTERIDAKSDVVRLRTCLHGFYLSQGRDTFRRLCCATQNVGSCRWLHFSN